MRGLWHLARELRLIQRPASLPPLPLDSGLSQASSRHSLEAGYIVSNLHLYRPLPVHSLSETPLDLGPPFFSLL